MLDKMRNKWKEILPGPETAKTEKENRKSFTEKKEDVKLSPAAAKLIEMARIRYGNFDRGLAGKRTRVAAVELVQFLVSVEGLDEALAMELCGIGSHRYKIWESRWRVDSSQIQKEEETREQWIRFLSSHRFIVASILIFAFLFPVFYLYVDRPAILWMDGFRRTEFRRFFDTFTFFGESFFYLLFGGMAFLLARRLDHRTSTSALLLIFAVALSGLFVNLLKVVFARMRPELFLTRGSFGFTFFHFDFFAKHAHQFQSFPSGHSATGLSVGLAFAVFFPRYRIPFLLSGVMIAVSRWIVLRHYPSDILAGALIGIITTALLAKRLDWKKGIGS